MAVNTITFSAFQAGNLGNTTNTLVGVSAPSGGQNIQFPFPLVWTTTGRPVTPAVGTLGFNSTLGLPEYWNGSAWTQLGGSGGGTVNSGSANQLAYYASNGTAVSGLTTANDGVLVTSALGVPSISTTLPAGLTIQTPLITGVVNASNASAGNVGELISSIIAAGSAISLSSTVPANITSIVLTPGDWDVWGNVTFIGVTTVNPAYAWISTTSATLPDPSLYGIISAGTPFGNVSPPVPGRRFNVSVNTTVYLSAQATIGGSASACGGIYARRRR